MSEVVRHTSYVVRLQPVLTYDVRRTTLSEDLWQP